MHLIKWAAVAAFFASCAPAYAQDCKERGAAVALLEQSGAAVAGRGSANGLPVQVWVFPNGNWIMVLDNGVALCIFADGTDWRNEAQGELM